ncbi:MAG: VCBS repeat-containing protein [Xanthomonadales bacterium]|nr:VCBS repeat-containing protein [Xanthomonadales bacterium]
MIGHRCGLIILIPLLFAISPHARAAPTLGVYPNSPVGAGANSIVTPNAVPTGTTAIHVSTNTSFKGSFVANLATGVVRVTNAHPAGTYAVTVKAFGGGDTTSRNFTLTVNTGTVCTNPVVFNPAANVTTTLSTHLALAVGDFNNDGNQDLAASGSGAAIRLGDGLGGFSGTTVVSLGTLPFGLATGDFNMDGNLDLAASSFTGNSVSIRLGDGLGGFSGTTSVGVGTSPNGLAVGDFNKDGKPDFAAANSASATVSIRLGDGLGGFSGTTEVSTNGNTEKVVVGDFNADGNPDIASSNEGQDTVSIRLGDGAGGFSGTTNVSVGNSPPNLAIGDFNGDGKQDLALTRFRRCRFAWGTAWVVLAEPPKSALTSTHFTPRSGTSITMASRTSLWSPQAPAR